jgi:DNA-binding response OmpR family regulator/AraC-like DNA-binding protein
VPGPRRPVILTVDDNRALHEVYALAFERDYEHVRAYGGEEALEIVRGKTIDVMVLDLRMPGLGGMDVLEQAFRLKRSLIVVVSSVIDTSQSALRAIRLGAADYFVKPTEPEVMELAVRQLLAAHDDPTVAIPQPALVARRVLVVGADPGMRAALMVALQPRCRVDVAARISKGIEMLGTMMPDLVIVDLRSASLERVLGLQSLQAIFPEGPMIVIGSPDRIGPLLQPAGGSPTLIIPEPVDFGLLFQEIATLLPADPNGAPMKPLGAASSKAVERAVARYDDHTVRVAHLSAGTGLSSDHFAHVFREEMGLPPMEYLVRVRVQAAIFVLRETRDKVSTVARRFGFYDGPHLALTLRRRGLGRPQDFRAS